MPLSSLATSSLGNFYLGSCRTPSFLPYLHRSLFQTFCLFRTSEMRPFLSSKRGIPFSRLSTFLSYNKLLCLFQSSFFPSCLVLPHPSCLLSPLFVSSPLFSTFLLPSSSTFLLINGHHDSHNYLSPFMLVFNLLRNL